MDYFRTHFVQVHRRKDAANRRLYIVGSDRYRIKKNTHISLASDVNPRKLIPISDVYLFICHRTAKQCKESYRTVSTIVILSFYHQNQPNAYECDVGYLVKGVIVRKHVAEMALA